jgi:hypothetical protein
MPNDSNSNSQPSDDAPASRPTNAHPEVATAISFDPARLRLSQDFPSAAGVKKVITTVPCRRPPDQEFVRVRPGEERRLETGMFEDKVRRENYLVEPSLWPELLDQIRPV